MVAIFLLCAGCAVAEPELHYGTPPEGFKGMEVLFLDINRGGDSIYIRCGEQSMLIDAGMKTDGTRIQVYLEKWNITGVTYLLNTHSHNDHISGLIQLLKNGFNAQEGLAPYSTKKKESYFQEYLKRLKKREIPYRQVADGESMTLGDAQITFFRATDDTSMRSRNENSLVTRVQYGDCSILLPADIGGNPQRKIAAQYGKALDADIVKSAHHGLALFVDEWLEAVSPSFVVCTNNEGSAVAFEQQMAELNIPMLFASEGVVHLVTDGNDWYIWQTGRMGSEDEEQLRFPAAP